MKLEKMEKTVAEAIKKLDKLKVGDSLAAELSWCWVSYMNDNNPVGVIEKSQKALEVLQEVKTKNSKAVSKKLIEDLQKAVN